MATDAPQHPRLLVSVTEIRRKLGTRMDVSRELEVEGMALSDVSVPDGASVSFEGQVESISDGVVLTGQTTVPWVGSCRRCLRDVSGRSVLDVREVYETVPTEGETWPLEGDQIDLGPLLHDTALLALPLAPLCAEDCEGPDPDRFPAVVEDEEDPEGDPPRDPRWAALDDLDL